MDRTFTPPDPPTFRDFWLNFVRDFPLAEQATNDERLAMLLAWRDGFDAGQGSVRMAMVAVPE
jgi:hypothetical protein